MAQDERNRWIRRIYHYYVYVTKRNISQQAKWIESNRVNVKRGGIFLNMAQVIRSLKCVEISRDICTDKLCSCFLTQKEKKSQQKTECTTIT